MFTGIVAAVGEIVASEPRGGDRRLRFTTGGLDLADLRNGDSVSVSGVCLTALEVDARRGSFAADLSAETLARSVLGELDVGAAVNLELALTPSTRLGGHLVGGHIDGVGRVREFVRDARSWRLTVEAPAALARYIAEKGSICIDGVSLTVNNVGGAVFAVNVIPHTLQQTTIGAYRPGRRVNLEVDLIARYLERLLQGGSARGGLSAEVLRRSGFATDD